MLPTEKAEDCLYLQNNKLNYHNGYLTQEYLKNSLNAKSYHLHFLSDEEIKEGDYFLRGSNPKFVYKCTKITNRSYWCNGNEYLKEECKKIIVTTDRNLKLYKSEILAQNSGFSLKTNDIILPQPSLDFIKVYIEEYNKGSQILEVNVLYEKKVIGEKPVPFGYENIYEDNFTLKINSKDNTITIRPIKNSWSREEIYSLVDEYDSTIDTYQEYKPTVLEWIKKNL